MALKATAPVVAGSAPCASRRIACKTFPSFTPSRLVITRFQTSKIVDWEKESMDDSTIAREWPMSWGFAALQDLEDYSKSHPATTSRSVAINPSGTVMFETAGEAPDWTGEWPMAWGLTTFEDLGEFYKQRILKADAGARLSDIMSRTITAVTVDVSLDCLKGLFQSINVSGMPVVDADKHLIGVVSKKDLDKPGSTVGEVMSSPPVACKPGIKVKDAAALMLKHKVHRIPVVDADAHVIGMVTRTDIFTALEQGK